MGPTELYPAPMDKLALALESARIAKEIEVAEQGIGEDLRLNLMAWDNARLIASAQLIEEPESRLDRVRCVAVAAQVLRSGFGADAFTMLLEGFCALDRDLVDSNENLAEAFVAGDPNISECLVAMNVDATSHQIGMLPYRYLLGRRVEWKDAITYPPVAPDDGLYPIVLNRAIVDTEPRRISVARKVFHEELAKGLRGVGFTLVWGAP